MRSREWRQGRHLAAERADKREDIILRTYAWSCRSYTGTKHEVLLTPSALVLDYLFAVWSVFIIFSLNFYCL